MKVFDDKLYYLGSFEQALNIHYFALLIVTGHPFTRHMNLEF